MERKCGYVTGGDVSCYYVFEDSFSDAVRGYNLGGLYMLVRQWSYRDFDNGWLVNMP
jgi:hypothetical protein